MKQSEIMSIKNTISIYKELSSTTYEKLLSLFESAIQSAGGEEQKAIELFISLLKTSRETPQIAPISENQIVAILNRYFICGSMFLSLRIAFNNAEKEANERKMKIIDICESVKRSLTTDRTLQKVESELQYIENELYAIQYKMDGVRAVRNDGIKIENAGGKNNIIALIEKKEEYTKKKESLENWLQQYTERMAKIKKLSQKIPREILNKIVSDGYFPGSVLACVEQIYNDNISLMN